MRKILFVWEFNTAMDDPRYFIWDTLWNGNQFSGYANAPNEEILKEWNASTDGFSDEDWNAMADDLD